MNYEERLKEAERLERDNHALLSTPLMSEGNISPMQVGMFSKRQKERWQENARRKMNLMYQINRLRRTDEEIAKSESIIKDKERQARINQLRSQISAIENLGRMSHKENGQLKPSYQRTIDIANKELWELSRE